MRKWKHVIVVPLKTNNTQNKTKKNAKKEIEGKEYLPAGKANRIREWVAEMVFHYRRNESRRFCSSI